MGDFQEPNGAVRIWNLPILTSSGSADGGALLRRPLSFGPRATNSRGLCSSRRAIAPELEYISAQPLKDPVSSLEAEAIRLFRRYEVEIVSALKFCPWADRARAENRVKERVLSIRSAEETAPLDAILGLSKDPDVEIGLLLLPLLEITQPALERFVSRLVEADAERRPLGAAPFAMAAFHPDAAADPSSAERLVPFIRRTPDPTIQLVRCDVLDRVRQGFHEGTQFVDVRALSTLGAPLETTLPLRERIARANRRTVERLGVSEVERRLNAIRRDRTETYARLGVLTP